MEAFLKNIPKQAQRIYVASKLNVKLNQVILHADVWKHECKNVFGFIFHFEHLLFSLSAYKHSKFLANIEVEN